MTRPLPYLCAASLVWLLLAPSAGAQDTTGSIHGVISDAETGDPLPAATLVLRRSQRTVDAVASDARGRFRFSDLEPGTYVLRSSYLGFDVRLDTLSLSAGRDLEVAVRLAPTRTELRELVVESSRDEEDRFLAGLETIRPEDLARVPMPDVSYDLAGYLQTLPGVVTTGDRGGQLFVRGGTPTQNLILLDGMPIFQPFHIVGFYSAFPADIVAYSDVYAGGFGARYGGRISSVIDIATRNGNKREVRATASIAPFLSGITAEIPIEEDKVSLLLSMRESIIDRISSPLTGEELPFRFGDRFLKFHANLTQTSNFSFTALQSFDSGNLAFNDGGSELTRSRKSTWRNQAYGARYTYIPADAAVMAEGTVFVSRLSSRYRLTPTEVREADVSGLQFGINFAYLLGDSDIHFGIFAGTNSFDWDLGSFQIARSAGVSSGGAYAEFRLTMNEYLRLEPSLRVESFSRGQGRNIAPRARVIILPTGSGSRHQLSFAVGKYHQQIVGVSNQQDVSEVFTIWAASPKSTPVPQATHVIGGWKARVFPWLEFKTEAYWKDLKNLSFPVFTSVVNELSEFSVVDGEARGLDASLDLTRRTYSFSAGYSLAKVDYHRERQLTRGIFTSGPSNAVFLDAADFSPPHDRRHQLNVMGRVNFGRNSIGARWQFGSGLPFTQINGYFRGLPDPVPNDPNFLTTSGVNSVSRGELYGERLPPYHRLDVTFERTVMLGATQATFQSGVINVYDRANIFEYNIFSGERIDQLPLIPSVGVRLDFR